MDTVESVNIDKLKNPFKIILIVMTVAAISILHYTTIHAQLGQHIPHKGLYLIPVILASFWYGRKIGLVTSVSISLIYAPHVIVFEGFHSNILAVSFQVLELNIVAFMLGWLVDRRKRQLDENIVTENLAVLGRAATAVGHEMKTLLIALKSLAKQARGYQCTELDKNFSIEMARLEKMVDVLSSFKTKGHVELFSHDLNEIVHKNILKFKKEAIKIGVNIKVTLDESSCPSRVNVNQIDWVVEQIFKNALEVSSNGDTINFRSLRSGQTCIIDIEDEGPGISQKNLINIFAPFFTTKKEGYGLALAACRKALRDMGGDVTVKSIIGKGATFSIIVPREYTGKPLATDPIETVLNGNEVRGMYRE